MLAEILKDTLSTRNFVVHLAHDGSEALENVQHEKYDVIVSDIMMPVLDGFSLAKELRSKGITTPILFLTARSATEDVVKGFEMGGEELHTFANNSVSQIAALKQIDIIERDNLLENTNVVGKYIAGRLEEMQKEIPQIGDIRQVGLHIGIEMVEDPATKEPSKKAAELKAKALENGMILGTGGFRKNILKIKPPLITTLEEAKEICDIFYKTLKEVL